MPRRFKLLTILCLILSPVAWKAGKEIEITGIDHIQKTAVVPPVIPKPSRDPVTGRVKISDGEDNPYQAVAGRPGEIEPIDRVLREKGEDAESIYAIGHVIRKSAKWLLIAGCVGSVFWFLFPHKPTKEPETPA